MGRDVAICFFLIRGESLPRNSLHLLYRGPQDWSGVSVHDTSHILKETPIQDSPVQHGGGIQSISAQCSNDLQPQLTDRSRAFPFLDRLILATSTASALVPGIIPVGVGWGIVHQNAGDVTIKLWGNH